jgi:hypothetical protein
MQTHQGGFMQLYIKYKLIFKYKLDGALSWLRKKLLVFFIEKYYQQKTNKLNLLFKL